MNKEAIRIKSKGLCRLCWLIGLFLAGGSDLAVLNGLGVTLAWDPNPEPDIAGYILHYGTNTGQYVNTVNVGKVTTNVVTGLAVNVPYYFAVTAYNSSGLESDFSNEISYTVTSTNSTQTNTTVIWTAPADIVYGTALGSNQLNASSSVPGTFVYAPSAGTILNAGSNQALSVSFIPTDTNSFAPVSARVAINVRPASLTIAPMDTNKLYGAAVPALSAGCTGFVNGDTAANLTTPIRLTTAATAASPVGNYTITPSGATCSNYTISYLSGRLTVIPAALTIAANNTNKVYGAPMPLFSASYSGFVNGDTPGSLATVANLTTTATTASSAGNYPITPSGASGSNYIISYSSGTLTVTPASTVGTLNSSANPSLPGQLVTFTWSPIVVSPGTGTPSGSVRFRVDGKNAGAPISLSGGAAPYSIANLALGNHTVVAEYAGNANFIGATNALAPVQLVNTPPVARPDQIATTNGVNASVSVATLLSNDSDADGDAVTFAGVSATSANNGTLTLTNNFVVYNPPPGITNLDIFTYTISDGRGTSVTGTVTVNITLETVPPPQLRLTPLAGGALQLHFAGVAGKTYHIQYSEDLRNPAWQSLGTGTADPSGLFVLIDTPPQGTTRRFYRAVYP